MALIVGSDPECFLKDANGNIISAIGIIPGNKVFPIKTKHGSIQPDNVLAEFNSKPAHSLSAFILNHQLIMGDLLDRVKPLGLNLEFKASNDFGEGSLALMHPLAMEAGCLSDMNAWTGEENPKVNYYETFVRAAGGHLHISFDRASTGNLDIRKDFTKCLDLRLGVPSILYDSDSLRRQYYGKAGSFRPKFINNGDPYDGVEYRTLSNFWLKSEETMTFVYKGIEDVYNNFEEILKIVNNLGDRIVNIINTSNVKEAAYLSKELKFI